MVAITLNGQALALEIQDKLKDDVREFQKRYQCAPNLSVIVVGNNPASQVYVRNKSIVAEKIGFVSETITLPENITQDELLKVIEERNTNRSVHGILVQLPLPNHIDEQIILTAIDVHKDVDGFHSTNVGNFILGNESTVACTPLGIMHLLRHYDISLSGKLAVVIGRSNIVGKPMAMLLQQEHATVIMAHSKTQNLKELTKQADIIVVAIGQGHFIDETYIKEGAVVIDVGMNRDANGQLIGDVHPNVMQKASFMTPVPGGVGPMTITSLMQQTLQQAIKQEKSYE
ncbi:bifunctional 5,10-methylenetetrahydrofolate dehydrogenase/5,10-methenyltetrahydrofolate cyclohydrolase [Carnobacteriaceae bacterium zg-ZUI252]|nr:bifunctional 5,10-methylenetetrahydrofolate dehydrogenase/5,10-methenyltetrahydrofolate cyclohydrolase [Carnobacteriaceae bacterium zg-ZUI252]MBS4770578.1 bifunctional 5,10-methylenetetrahydrofolate dehydrogenase/5,10-methenyltetrahydrofolate cyclohydrolase [Carnobacteriaceae bacterium zg-ZUI240]QTU83496.1 bifunctional 5,10-methylenetetrahydrofolate dehydrogenase/5,10-methenyltetrahydrofolate cyclohydrolase [Carnobacteriaceae bacterium zg-C25]